MTEAQQCTCTGTDAGLNPCADCPTPWTNIPGASRIMPRFTARPVTPEIERAATDRARQAAAESERAAEWVAAHSSPHPAEARLAHLQAASEAAGILLTRTTDERDQLAAVLREVLDALVHNGGTPPTEADVDRWRAALDGQQPAPGAEPYPPIGHTSIGPSGREAAAPCPGFPIHCPNPRNATTSPPDTHAGIRCGCGNQTKETPDA